MQPREVRIHRSLPAALRAFDADRFRWFDEAAAAGPLTRLRFGPVSTWVVSDPEIARRMLIADGDSWERPPAGNVPIRLGVGENLFTQSDEAWAILQPSVSPAFRHRALGDRLTLMPSIMQAFVDNLPKGSPLDPELEMGALALQIAAWILLGDHLDEHRARTLAGHQRAVVTWVGTRIGQVRSVVPFATGASARAMRSHREELERYADEVIDRRIFHAGDGTDVGEDVLGCLLSATPGGKPLTSEERRSHVLGMLLAGNETTAAALCWALVHAAAHPTQWSRCATDAPYAEAFVAETLRLTPAVWGFARRPKRRGVTVEGQRIGRSQPVTIYLYGINRRADFWDDPNEFRPERHLRPDPAASASMLSFGLGLRSCIGQHLALAEMHAAVSVLARHRVQVNGPVIADPSFALRIRGGLRATLFTDR